MGLSPHVRGIRLIKRLELILKGSIPACTGNPVHPKLSDFSFWVYPRMYGESVVIYAKDGQDLGLSPHVRGIQGDMVDNLKEEGSIPACTGNPRMPAISSHVKGVYPRMYGESRRR